MALEVSVIIHTVNPRPEYLRRVLHALEGQTLDLSSWELVIVDNGSKEELAGKIDLSWHPQAKCIREERRGAPWARVCGLRAATPGALVIFIDDDNVPVPDYLETALAIGRLWPMLGAWGGQVEAVYDGQPPAWVGKFTDHLAIRKCSQSRWSTFVDVRSMPVGAGLCVHPAVAARYLVRAKKDPNFARFGRQPDRDVSGDDQYICFCAQEVGLGLARFPELKLQHLIPAGRLEPATFLRIVRGNNHGGMLLHLCWKQERNHRTKLYWPFLKGMSGLLFHRGMYRRVIMAEARGEYDAIMEARTLTLDSPPFVEPGRN